MDLVVDKIAYSVRVTPFSFNNDLRYYVSINNGPSHVFVWDGQMLLIRSIDDEGAQIPDGLEKAISDKLISAN